MGHSIRRRKPDDSWHSKACETVDYPVQPRTWSFPVLGGLVTFSGSIHSTISHSLGGTMHKLGNQLGNTPPTPVPVFSSQGRLGSPMNMKSSPPTPAVTCRYQLSR